MTTQKIQILVTVQVVDADEQPVMQNREMLIDPAHPCDEALGRLLAGEVRDAVKDYEFFHLED